MEENNLVDLLDAFLMITNKEDLYKFMKDLLTPKEMESFGERWRVCQLLDQQKLSYREIHKETGASLVTIGRVARFLREESYQGYRIVLDKIKASKELS